MLFKKTQCCNFDHFHFPLQSNVRDELGQDSAWSHALHFSLHFTLYTAFDMLQWFSLQHRVFAIPKYSAAKSIGKVDLWVKCSLLCHWYAAMGERNSWQANSVHDGTEEEELMMLWGRKTVFLKIAPFLDFIQLHFMHFSNQPPRPCILWRRCIGCKTTFAITMLKL